MNHTEIDFICYGEASKLNCNHRKRDKTYGKESTKGMERLRSPRFPMIETKIPQTFNLSLLSLQYTIELGTLTPRRE